VVGFSEKECVGCDRCGAFIPKILAQFHQCAGSDMSKRPANVPLEQWIAARNVSIPNFDKWFEQLMAVHGKWDEMSPMISPYDPNDGIKKPAPKSTRKPVRRPIVVPRLVLLIAGALVGVALGEIVKWWFR